MRAIRRRRSEAYNIDRSFVGTYFQISTKDQATNNRGTGTVSHRPSKANAKQWTSKVERLRLGLPGGGATDSVNTPSTRRGVGSPTRLALVGLRLRSVRCERQVRRIASK